MLLDRDGVVEDVWRRPQAPDFAGARRRLVPLADFLAAPQAGARGVEIANTTAAEALAPHLAALALIAIVFPGFGDGRGLSLARRLRRLGYGGRLRAVGPLVPDQAADLAACGVDEIELPPASAARQTPEQWARARAAHAAVYQHDYAGAGPTILEARRARAESARA